MIKPGLVNLDNVLNLLIKLPAGSVYFRQQELSALLLSGFPLTPA